MCPPSGSPAPVDLGFQLSLGTESPVAPAAPPAKGRGRGKAADTAAAAAVTAAAPCSRLLPTLKYFLEFLAFDTALAVTTPTDSTAIKSTGLGGLEALTPAQMDALFRLRAIVVCRLFALLTLLLTSTSAKRADVRCSCGLHGIGAAEMDLWWW